MRRFIAIAAALTAVAFAITGCSSGTSVTTAPTPTVATPTFSVAAGTYTAAQTVSLSTTTPGAQIYYTTNLSTPTPSATLYTGPITVASSETVQAIAVEASYNSSSIASVAYVINLPAATPTFSVAAGTYTAAQSVTLSSTTSGAQIYYTLNGSTPTTSSTLYTGAITVSASETIEAIATASGFSASPVATAAYVINLPAASPTFSVAAGTYTAAQTVTLSSTTPGAQIYYTTNGSAPTISSTPYTGAITVSTSETIEAIAIASGFSSSPVASSAYVINIAAAPTFSIPPGTYTSQQTVALSSATAGAQIYYTTNGTTPTTSSTLYTSPIVVPNTETLEAIATATGAGNSTVSSAAYTINLPAPTVTLTLSSASFSLASPSTAAVQVSCNIACGQVDLKIDGAAWQSGTLNATGTYSTIGYPALTNGTHILQAFYPGNGAYAAASSSQVNFTITGAASGTPHAVLSTSFLEFNNFGAYRDITLSNTGSGPLLISSIGTYTPYFWQTNNCGSSVAAGGSCTISIADHAYVSFPTIQAFGDPDDQLVVTSNDPTGTVGAALVSEIYNSSPTVESLSNIAFGSTVIGTSAADTLSIPAASSSQCVPGAAGSDFSVSVLSNGPCTLQVTFTPIATGLRTGRYALGTDGSYIPLSGIGVSALSTVATLTPASVTIQDFNGPASVTLSNYGSTALNIQSISVSPGFTQTNTCGASLAAQTVCTISVSTATILVPEGIEGLLTVADDQGTQSIKLTGIIDTPLLFGAWPVGTSSPLIQQGSTQVSYTASASGADPQDFAVANVRVAGAIVAPTVQFKPTAIGVRTATEAIDLGGASPPAYSLLLQGIGEPADGSSRPDPAPMPVQATPVGTSIIYNQQLNDTGASPGTAAYNGSEITGANAQDFVQGSHLFFAPTSVGVRTANLVLTSSTTGQTYTEPIAAIGTSAAPVVTPPASISAQAGTTSTLTFGVAPLDGHAIAAYLDAIGFLYNPGTANPFSLVKSTCAQGESPCQITLAFSPTAASYLVTTLFVVDTVTGSPAIVQLNGVIAPGTLTLSPTAVNFGTRAVNTTSVAQTLTLTATNGTATYFAPTVSGTNASEFAITGGTCPMTQNGPAPSLTNASCTINVSFAPTTTGSKSASVVVAYGNAQTLTTALTGVAQ